MKPENIFLLNLDLHLKSKEDNFYFITTKQTQQKKEAFASFSFTYKT